MHAAAALPRSRSRLRQWRGLVRVYLAELLAYPATISIWVLTDVVGAVVMPLVWLTARNDGMIGGYTPQGLVVYYVAMLLVGGFVTSHFMWDIGIEIKEGLFTAHVLRPVSYFEFILCRNFAWRLGRTIVTLPWFALILFAYASTMGAAPVHLGWETWASVFLGHLVSISSVLAIAMLALFVEEARTIFEVYYLPMMFLSGQMFPVGLLPDWAAGLAKSTPFYYTTGLPTEILTGTVAGADASRGMVLQCAWIAGSLVAYALLFRAGMRRYTAVGL
jgi:ABC-2 type transport system permease protein